MEKVLTVLVPVYNTEKYIKRCLDSLLLNETNDDVEILVVSDGSKDKSVEIVKKYQKKFADTINLIEKENGGHGSTINVGIEKAKGKYFKVLDSDDWVDSKDFIKLVKNLKNENADLVVTNYAKEHVYSGVSEPFKYDKLKENVKYNFNKFDLELLHGEYFMMATSTYKTDVLRKAKLRLMEKTFYVDMQYNLIPIEYVDTFVFYNLDIYRYFIGRADQSVNVSSFVKNKDDHEKVLRSMIEFYENKKGNMSSNKKKYIAMIINYTVFTHYTIFCQYDKDRKDAFRKIKKFDDLFKKTSLELYKKSNELSFIRLHRETNFIFVRYFRRLYSKLFTLLKKVRRGF